MGTQLFPRASVPFVLAIGVVALPAGVRAKEPPDVRLPPAAARRIDFRRDVYPLLKSRCFKCHQGARARAGYRLDLRDEILGKTKGQPLVRVGGSAQSRLIHLVAGAVPDKTMPENGRRLTANEVGLLRAWIDQGLTWDAQLLPAGSGASRHWAFRPVTRPAVPRVKNNARLRNPVDAFIAARQEAWGVIPAPRASRPVLIRRLYLDLIGIPPRPEEIDAFEADNSPAAYERQVERLLASPHYGERWGRHWLDVARWAESEGYESNHPRPHAWRYRDYVVRTFNRDTPYDRFVREQVAGDELLPYSDDNLIATGFLAAARLSSNEEDEDRQRNDILVDIVNATGSAFLGLTLNCAQCHRHKFDPIPAKDYYRFQGFFVKGQPANLALRDSNLWKAYEAAKPADYDPAVRLRDLILQKAEKRLTARLKSSLPREMLQALDTPADRRTPRQQELARQAGFRLRLGITRIEQAIRPEDRKLFKELKRKIAALEKRMLDKPQTFGFYSPATSPTRVEVLPMKGFYPLPYEPAALARARPYFLASGEVHRRGPVVDVGWPEVFGPVPKGAAGNRPRLSLADWLTSRRNPLTARVWVNRLWHYHFGRGLVATPGDFGLKGAPCTHPELLDWLASELMASGWSTKHLHRLLVCSSTYCQGSTIHAGNTRLDPQNKWWWRWQPRRLEAEAIRDSMLAAGGELDRRLGGPGIVARRENSRRRSLYLFQKRENPPALQGLFDGPNASAESCPRRSVSTVPLQALYLLNNDFALGRARALARRVFREAGADQARQTDTAFFLALGRRPDEAECRAAETFFASQARAVGRPGEPPAALVLFCQAVLNLNEFVYLE
jgi:hypothetical protein